MTTTTHHPAITLRPARFSDLPHMAQIFSSAFRDESLFGVIMHPHRHQYPADMALWKLRRIRLNYWNWTHRFFVTTMVDQVTKREVVTGWAEWARWGEEGRRKWGLRWWDPRNLLTPLTILFNRLSSLVYPNRAIEPSKEDVLDRGFPYIAGLWSGPRAETCYLEMLAVDPKYHGQGCGRELVRWGLEQAAKEGVCASVISADGKERFYQKCGFDLQEGRAGQGDGNPLRDVAGGLIFWKEPNIEKKAT